MDVDRYEILRLLGRGNVGNVFLARHRMTGREVALKVSDPRGDPELAARVLNEARITASARHPSLVEVYDCGALEDGRVFVAMQLVEGRTLESLLEAEGGRMAPARAARLALQVLEALDALHERGIIHRDIKPSNLLVQRRGEHEHVFVIDFGISKQLDPSPQHTPAPTISGTILGTPGYMPPEQLDARTVDARADLFAVGAVLFRCISGRTLFDADSLGDWFIALSQREAPSLAAASPTTTASLCAVVDEALSLDRERRPPSAKAMHARLAAASSETESTDLAVVRAAPDATVRRVSWPARVAACAALLVAGGVLALGARSQRERDAPPASAAPAAPAASEADPLQSALAGLAMRAFDAPTPSARPTTVAPSARVESAAEPALIASQSGAVSLRSALASPSVDIGEIVEWVQLAMPEIEQCRRAPGEASARFSLVIRQRSAALVEGASAPNALGRCAFRAMQRRSREGVVALRSSGTVRDLRFVWR